MFQKEIATTVLNAVDNLMVEKIHEAERKAYDNALADVIYNIGNTLTAEQIICIECMRTAKAVDGGKKYEEVY